MSTSRLLGCVVALLCTASTAAWAQFDNSAPVPALIPNAISVTAGSLFTLDASQSYDPDGDPFTFSWSQITGDPVTMDLSDPSMPIFTAPSTAQTLQLLLTVTDDCSISQGYAGCSDSNSLSLNVTVLAVPEPAAAWMFGSGILTLLGAARLRKQFA